MSARLTASKLPMAEECVGAFVLPTVERVIPAGRRGRRIHKFLQNARNVGREFALTSSDLTEEERATCEGIDLEKAWALTGDTFATEVALAWHVGTGEVRWLGEDTDRSIYRESGLDPVEWIFGSADTIGDDGEVVTVGDYKTGRTFVPLAKRNLQFGFLGMAAAIHVGRERARVLKIGIFESGELHEEAADLDEFDLDSVAARVRRIHQEVQESTPETVELTAGEHCQFCPAVQHCPAQVQSVQSLESIEARVQELSPVEVAKAFDKLQAADALLHRVRDGIRAYIETRGPVALGDGRELQISEVERESIVARDAFPILQQLTGGKNLGDVVSITKSGLERGLGKKDAAVALNEIRQAGAVKYSASRRMEARKIRT